ncbi:MAG TPA: hypothetical protein VIL49_10520 [Capillimicrobium sp.]|jgi:hypothetical protein
MPFETAVFDWRAGERRVEQAAPDERLAMERVVEAIVADLRRRIGITFTVDELVSLYDQGTDWCLDVAQRVAPAAPWAWEQATVADAAFHRFLRGATDYAGGRRLWD